MNEFQIIAIILLALGFISLIFFSTRQEKDTLLIYKIPLVFLIISSLMAIIGSFSPRPHNNNIVKLVDDNPDYNEVPEIYKNEVRSHYNKSHPEDITEFTYILSGEMINSLSTYRNKAKIKDTDEIKIGISSIKYKKASAMAYLEHIFSKYPQTKTTFINYYNKKGWEFTDKTPISELAEVIINRNSHMITLENFVNSYSEFWDMGRLCPPNCPN